MKKQTIKNYIISNYDSNAICENFYDQCLNVSKFHDLFIEISDFRINEVRNNIYHDIYSNKNYIHIECYDHIDNMNVIIYLFDDQITLEYTDNSNDTCIYNYQYEQI